MHSLCRQKTIIDTEHSKKLVLLEAPSIMACKRSPSTKIRNIIATANKDTGVRLEPNTQDSPATSRRVQR
jgi:hypothetical protein